MSELRTPKEWAIELGLLVARKSRGQSVGSVLVPATPYAAAAALHQWAHDEQNTDDDERLRISRETFDDALRAAVLLLQTPEGLAHVPEPAALGKYTPASIVERAKRIREQEIE